AGPRCGGLPVLRVQGEDAPGRDRPRRALPVASDPGGATGGSGLGGSVPGAAGARADHADAGTGARRRVAPGGGEAAAGDAAWGAKEPGEAGGASVGSLPGGGDRPGDLPI